MNIEELIILLNNRLRDFKLSRDYARMSGDLARMNAADKEVITLEDTLYKLNLLADTSKSAAVKEAILAEVITDGSVAVLGEYDISLYATDPLHEEKIMDILSKMKVMDTVEKINDYIENKYLSSPVTGEMIMSAAEAYIVDARLMMAIMEQDSRFGTVGVAVRTLNPGNVGNNDDGDTVTYESWQEGVTAVAEWLNRHRGSTIIPKIPEETVLEPASPAVAFGEGVVATSTFPFITPTTATSTPITATSTPITATSTPATATTTPVVIITSTPATATTTPVTATSTSLFITPTTASTTPATATSTPTTATSTPTTATSTPTTATTTPVTATSTEETIPVITSTTTTTTATSTPTTATTTPVTATSTEETIPVITSTTTTTTATSTDSTPSTGSTSPPQASSQPSPSDSAEATTDTEATADEARQATSTPETAATTDN